MALPTALLVKGLAGVGAVASVVGGGFLVKKLLQPKDPNEIIRDLGISDCKLEEGQSKTNECELDETKVKAINFTNKTGSDQTVSGLSGDKKLKLVIEKDYDTTDFPEGLRFTITNTDTTTEVVIGTDPNKITLKANTSYDFKIKDDTKLEKAWTLTTLGKKVGLNCANDDATECTLPTTGINVWKSNEDYITNAQISDSNKNMTVAKETSSYKQGLKFTLKEEGEITLSEGKKKKSEGGISQLTKTNMSYEIDIKEVDGTKTWFLVEKSTASG